MSTVDVATDAAAAREHRRAAARQRLAERDVDGLLVTTLVNVAYLSGFTGSHGALLLPAAGTPVLLTDGRYRDQAAAETSGVDVVVVRDLLARAVTAMPGRWAVETHTLSVDAHARLGAVETVSAERLVEELRTVKDAVEIDALRRACALSVAALEQLWEGPLLGRTEREVARALENRMLDLGAEAIGFPTIVAAGENAAIPHHQPTDRTLRAGDLLKTDFGARVDGYHADCTRTVALGRADGFAREIHAVVRQAQAAGVTALVAGTPIADVDAVPRAVLDEAGWLEYFTTGLGHGVGRQIHEDPFLGPGARSRLDDRAVVTMEPGIYVAGRGGVRIEDTVVVTTGAPECLTELTTELLEIA